MAYHSRIPHQIEIGVLVNDSLPILPLLLLQLIGDVTLFFGALFLGMLTC